MNKMPMIQTGLWAIFLLYYCASKFLAGYQGYSHAYLIQVVIIVAATAVIPYYLTRWAMKLEKLELAVAIFAPSLLAMAGYGGFFYVFIAPNFPDMAASQVIVRGLIPGMVISMILVLPRAMAMFNQRTTTA